MQDSEELLLSVLQSFRFGPEISMVANVLLQTLKGETKRTIVGHATPGEYKAERTRCQFMMLFFPLLGMLETIL